MRSPRQATVVLPGLGEGSLLTGHTEPAAIADFYLEAGAERVVVKLGADGAQAWDGDQTVRSRPYRVTPVDTVGAGDGFAAGYLDAFLAGRDLQACVDQAAAVGALATTRRGDLAAMPTRAELDLSPPANGPASFDLISAAPECVSSHRCHHFYRPR